jgi:hypothetical protein
MRTFTRAFFPIVMIVLALVAGAAWASSYHQTRWITDGKLLDAYAMRDGGSVTIFDVGATHHFDVIVTDSAGEQERHEILFPHRNTMPDVIFSEVCGDKLNVFFAWSDGFATVGHAIVELPNIQEIYLPQVCRGK